MEGAVSGSWFFRPAPAAMGIPGATGVEYTVTMDLWGKVELIAFQIHRRALLTGTLQTHKDTLSTCLNPKGGGREKGREHGEAERGWGRQRAAAASGPSRTRGHRAGPGLQVSQMMASENLNKGGRRRRKAAAESCGGGFPRSVAMTRALADASSPFPPPPRHRRGPAGEGKRKL